MSRALRFQTDFGTPRPRHRDLPAVRRKAFPAAAGGQVPHFGGSSTPRPRGT